LRRGLGGKLLGKTFQRGSRLVLLLLGLDRVVASQSLFRLVHRCASLLQSLVLARRKVAGNDSGNLEYTGIPTSSLLLAVVAGAVLLACMVLARRQVGFWRDSETLYQHTLRVTTNNYFINNTTLHTSIN
jgi:hypothetical protein